MSGSKEGRIYVCHTFYHVYISILKEFNLSPQERGNATMVLSTMSNDFKELPKRLKESGIFKEIVLFDEKKREDFPELSKWYADRGNIVANMFSRIVFTKKFAKLEAKYVPVDFKKYKDIYVFCDSDPIGLYLNQNRIYYHAVEDGLDTLVHFSDVHEEIKSHTAIKTFFSMKLNLIFIRDGYSKYCLDMEVNNLAAIKYKMPKYIEVPRDTLTASLSEEEKQQLIRIFVKNFEEIDRHIERLKDGKNILILTEPLCDLEVRKQIFTDLIQTYSKEGAVFLKPHPRDVLDYEKEFPNELCFDGSIPMEIFNLYPGLHFAKVVSVFTELANIHFADEAVRLGGRFMDKYEDSELHKEV